MTDRIEMVYRPMWARIRSSLLSSPDLIRKVLLLAVCMKGFELCFRISPTEFNRPPHTADVYNCVRETFGIAAMFRSKHVFRSPAADEVWVLAAVEQVNRCEVNIVCSFDLAGRASSPSIEPFDALGSRCGE